MKLKSTKHKVSVIAVVCRQGKILLGQRREKDGGFGQYVLPGGKIKDGEQFEQALLREVKEEVGLDIVMGSVLTATRSAHAGKNNVGIVFWATHTVPDQFPNGSDEIGEPQFYTLKEAEALNVMPVTREVFKAIHETNDSEFYL